MPDVWPSLPFGEIYSEPSLNGINAPSKVRGVGTRLVNMRELFAFDRIRDQDMELAPLSDMRRLIHEGDLLFARQSLVRSGAGRCVLVERSRHDRTFESHIIRVRLDASRADPTFFYYLFRSSVGRNLVAAIVNETAAAGVRSSDLAKLRVPVPPIDVQRRIASVLSTFDRRIDLNVDLIDGCRELAVAILHSASRGQAKFQVSTVAEVRRGLSYKGSGLADTGTPMVNMGSAANCGWLKRSGWKFYVGEYKDRHLAHGGDLIITNTEQTWRQEILGWPMLVPSDIDECLFTHHTYLVKFRPGHEWLRLSLWAFLYSAEARDTLVSQVQGSTVANLPSTAVENLLFAAAQKDDPGYTAAQSLLECAWAAERENESLTHTRDELLPLLVSGDLHVSEAAA